MINPFAPRGIALPASHQLVVTCEHATNHLPRRYALLFADRPQLLDTHCAYDPGALELAKRLSQRFSAPCFTATVSRLLVDCNRSLGHRHLFAPELDADERAALLRDHYLPYRQAATAAMTEIVSRGATVLHLSVHTFTPWLDDTERRADFALLYDPRRNPEKAFCHDWLTALARLAPGLRLRRNYPYRGVADGFTTALRREFPEERYLGIELEVSQKFPAASGDHGWQWLQEMIGRSLATAGWGEKD